MKAPARMVGRIGLALAFAGALGLGGSGRLAGQMTFPNSIGIDTRGNVFVGEVDMGKRIQKFAPVLEAAR